MTQCEKIVRHLEDCGSITPLSAMREYGIMRLASRWKKAEIDMESQRIMRGI